MQDLRPFFDDTHFIETKEQGSYEPLQWGANVRCFTRHDFDWEDADIVLVGCGEWRGEDEEAICNNEDS